MRPKIQPRINTDATRLKLAKIGLVAPPPAKPARLFRLLSEPGYVSCCPRPVRKGYTEFHLPPWALSLLLISVFQFFSISAFSATMYGIFTNSVGDPDTNIVRLIPVSGPVANADGSFTTIGLPIRVTPAADGRWTNRLALNNYVATNAYLGRGMVFRVPDDSATTNHYNIWDYRLSGYNVFVTAPPTAAAITNSLGYLPASPSDLNSASNVLRTAQVASTNNTFELKRTNDTAYGTHTFENVIGTNFSGNGTGLSNLTAANLTGALPAIDGSALTGITAGISPTNTPTVNNRMEATSGSTYRWTTNFFSFADGEIPVPSKRRGVLNGDSYLFGGGTPDSFLYWLLQYYPWSQWAGYTNASWPGTPFWPHRTNAWHNGIKQYMLESAGTTTTFDYFIWASGNEATPFQTNGMWLILTNHILGDVRPFAATNTFRIQVWILGATARENYMASASQRQGIFHYNNLLADSTNIWDYYVHAADIFTDPSNTNQSADVVHLNGSRYRKLVERVAWTAYFGPSYKLEPPVERFGSNLYFLNSHGDELAELRGDGYWTQVKMGYPVGNAVGANQPAIAVQPSLVSAPGLSVRGGGSTDAAAFQVENPSGTAKFSVYPTNGNWVQSAGNSSINGGGSLELTGGSGTGGINWWDFGGVGVYYQMKLRSDGAISINDVTNNKAIFIYTNTLSMKRDPGGNAAGPDFNMSSGLGDAGGVPGNFNWWVSAPTAGTQFHSNQMSLSYTTLVVRVPVVATNGVASLSSVASVAIAATGWTNIWATNNAVVVFGGTTVSSFKKRADLVTTNITYPVFSGNQTVILQPGQALVCVGTGVTGSADPF